jgi:hypothetical protein
MGVSFRRRVVGEPSGLAEIERVDTLVAWAAIEDDEWRPE